MFEAQFSSTSARSHRQTLLWVDSLTLIGSEIEWGMCGDEKKKYSKTINYFYSLCLCSEWELASKNGGRTVRSRGRRGGWKKNLKWEKVRMHTTSWCAWESSFNVFSSFNNRESEFIMSQQKWYNFSQQQWIMKQFQMFS